MQQNLTAQSRLLSVLPVTRQLTDRGEERRQQIITFATKRFAEKGYHPTSVAEIVDGIGVGKGVFYWYFSSKEELFIAILRDAQLDLRRCQQAALDPAADALDRISEGIRASVRWTADHPDLAVLVAFATTDERFAPMIRKGSRIATTDVMRHVEEAIAAELVSVTDAEMATRAMIGITTTLTREFLHDSTRTTDDVAEAAVEFCLGVLQAISAGRS